MREVKNDTPPSSISGDEIAGMESEEGIFFEEVEEVYFDEGMSDDEMNENESSEPPDDNSIIQFKKHTGSVFCCDIHPSGKIAVTGGEDDKAYVWSIETGEVILECSDMKDSVIFAGFSFDGSYLAVADMDGTIKVWKCNLDNLALWPLVFEYIADDLIWGLWHFGAKVLILGASTSNIYVFKIPSGETKVLQGCGSRVECGKLFQDGVRLVTGHSDGGLKIWDLKTNSVLHNLPESIHEQGRVTALDIQPGNNLVASITNEGKVCLVTAHNGKVVGQLQTEEELETIAFPVDSQLGLFALGTLNGDVSIWDVSRQMVRHHCTKAKTAPGVTKMLWVKDNLITACLDGAVRVYEGKSGELLSMMTGHVSELLDICYNAKENIILTASDDGTARIYKYEIKKETD